MANIVSRHSRKFRKVVEICCPVHAVFFLLLRDFGYNILSHFAIYVGGIRNLRDISGGIYLLSFHTVYMRGGD